MTFPYLTFGRVSVFDGATDTSAGAEIVSFYAARLVEGRAARARHWLVIAQARGAAATKGGTDACRASTW